MRKTVLITGGTGYIGSHVCYLFLKKGFNVISLDSNFNSSPKVNFSILNLLKSEGLDRNKYFKFIKGDTRNENLLRDLFIEQLENNKPISSVVHLAGLKSVKESVEYPLKYWSNNISGSISLFKIMQEFNCKIIVFSSSATIYGLSKDRFLTEESIINPLNPYGQTKATIENILEDLFSIDKSTWKIANLRYFNPIGAHPSGEIGEIPRNVPENIFPYILQVASGQRESLNIFGNDWPTPDGTGVRDYIHIMDLAESHLLALTYLLENPPRNICLNIGTNKGTSVLELVRIFEEVNNCNIPINFKARRIGDVAICVSANKLCRETLNWHPKRNIEDMCRDGWQWQSSHPNGY
tara:strand:- start:10166 stop:11221 length:1056 start_codon:yes stop_codon:yes gene_type:complete